jgi:2-polyprenyl-6-hydroxyphenyl methylase/3-demethylubiquinone-9 3-methyltransferase
MKNLTEQRFWFGKNWKEFISKLTEDQIERAKNSLIDLFGDNLKGKKFIDVGCGSGLFSLSAMLLGASVYSFDYDEESVECCLELKKRYFENDSNWTINQGSILDESFLDKLGQFDIVYSYGVLHHTGNLKRSLHLVTKLVDKEGCLYITLYNDQGRASIFWKKIKKIYINSNKLTRKFIFFIFFIYFTIPRILLNLLKLDFSYIFNKYRGMELLINIEDWLGGYPFEVSKPDDILDIYKKNFTLEHLVTVAGNHGNNEYLFQRKSNND